MRKFIEINFAFSTLVLIGGCLLYVFSVSQMGSGEIEAVSHSRFEATVWPLLVIAATLVAWIFLYRIGEGNGVALIIGMFVLIPAIGEYVSASVNDIESSGASWFLWYVGVSHLIYGVLDLGKLADLLNTRVR